MSKFKETKSFDYPIEDVFKGFIKITKREFPKFNEKNPIGIKHSRVVKDNGNRKLKMLMEITKFEKNKVYEITSKINNDRYISRYTFNKVNEDETTVMLQEEQHVKDFMSKIVVIIQSFLGTNKIKKKIARMSTGVTEEIELMKSKMEKNAKKY
ncbi:DUF3284 domain-containing protein [Clostridium gasigenes]|uniref:DUF3284 domain-containing protein n=1 Tax=Clostridium gasigenes TaxID=94869 RepID=UPI001C0BA92F|nr:DUF3284 domain-containing protein [Clostridium gasigenes]MBU3134733.1 DUF3284 domain-containing protein [Clostridium gasigenes]